MIKTDILYIHKKIEISEAVLYNILVDGLLSFGYSTIKARNMAESILSGEAILDNITGIKITRKRLLQAIKRVITSYEYEIEHASDSGREILLAIV